MSSLSLPSSHFAAVQSKLQWDCVSYNLDPILLWVSSTGPSIIGGHTPFYSNWTYIATHPCTSYGNWRSAKSHLFICPRAHHYWRWRSWFLSTSPVFCVTTSPGESFRWVSSAVNCCVIYLNLCVLFCNNVPKFYTLYCGIF